MKRILLFILVLSLLSLCGCALRGSAEHTITVSLTETPGCVILNNGLQIRTGEDAVFEVVIDNGYAFSALDYSGDYAYEAKNGREYIRLYDVRYPAAVEVSLTCDFRTVQYEPNGCTGQPVAVTYDITHHLRPNTSIGTDLYSREGYTLTGWNTEADGSGIAVGLGSRVSVADGQLLTLYAQWAKWSDSSDFRWSKDCETITITGYTGSDDPVVIPAQLDGLPVTAIADGALEGCDATHYILPPTMETLADGAFSGSRIRELTMFDNITRIGDAVFAGCTQLTTLHINAIEAPYGYDFRRESCFADKVDILIQAQGRKKLVFYGGCSMWYNLDGSIMQEALGDSYQVINMGLNGVINSEAQMQILNGFLENGDILFHTPEISSEAQLLLRTEMINHDCKLWSGLEYNYDLVSLLDLQKLPKFMDILQYWLSEKECTSSYTDRFTDPQGNNYVDQYGSASFPRQEPEEELLDDVFLDPKYIDSTAMSRLESHYNRFSSRGVRVYVGFACLNIDAVPPEQQDNIALLDGLFRDAFRKMENVTPLGRLQDHIYHNQNFYDTNYHLLTDAARHNTLQWLEELRQQMTLDGLWPEQ